VKSAQRSQQKGRAMDSKQFNRARTNGEAAGREGSRWKDERIAELEAERRLMARLLDEWQDNWNSSMMPDGDLIDDTNAMLAKIDASRT